MSAKLVIFPFVFFFQFAAFLVVPAQSASFKRLTISGDFLAEQACFALRRTDVEPDGVVLEVGERYGLIGRDVTGRFFLLRVPKAGKQRRRWVEADCGQAEIIYDPAAGISIAAGSIEHTLAVSWQPAFCATRRGQGRDGCHDLVPGEPATEQFSLHGLWPDDLDRVGAFPCYCHLESGPQSCFGKPRDAAGRLLDPQLPASLVAELSGKMPGSRGTLDDHEWTKHGTCHQRFAQPDQGEGATAQEYFEDSLLLLDQLNGSAVVALFRDHIGRELTAQQLRSAFDRAFGKGAGQRVEIICDRTADDNRTVIRELFISLKGAVEQGSMLSELILAAPEREADEQCDRGIVWNWS
ncbi:ribonuclease T2 family protein [Kiloniella sp. b19]|uniref:ribonuclease T2 family protein n=1 Tax=Kiloniella sp. GXU_MW_B19 TaxID=3141326 RepID=UPI0031D638B1